MILEKLIAPLPRPIQNQRRFPFFPLTSCQLINRLELPLMALGKSPPCPFIDINPVKRSIVTIPPPIRISIFATVINTVARKIADSSIQFRGSCDSIPIFGKYGTAVMVVQVTSLGHGIQEAIKLFWRSFPFNSIKNIFEPANFY